MSLIIYRTVKRIKKSPWHPPHCCYQNCFRVPLLTLKIQTPNTGFITRTWFLEQSPELHNLSWLRVQRPEREQNSGFSISNLTSCSLPCGWVKSTFFLLVSPLTWFSLLNFNPPLKIFFSDYKSDTCVLYKVRVHHCLPPPNQGCISMHRRLLKKSKGWV